MIQLTEQESKAFRALSESGEGAVVAGYLDRLQRHLIVELVDSGAATPEDIAGARQMRKLVTTLQERFVQRGRMKATFENVG